MYSITVIHVIRLLLYPYMDIFQGLYERRKLRLNAKTAVVAKLKIVYDKIWHQNIRTILSIVYVLFLMCLLWLNDSSYSTNARNTLPNDYRKQNIRYLTHTFISVEMTWLILNRIIKRRSPINLS